MRFVIFGAGAVGGVVGARLHQAGRDVTLIARGPHFESIQRDGLRFETPVERVVLKLPVVNDPAAVHWREEHVVLLVVKSQDTAGALVRLRAAAPPGVPVVCLQNGVDNERLALRMFGHVYGAVVMVPAAHLEPGLVQAYGAALTGIIDVGRYPSGNDERGEAIAEALAGAGFSSSARSDVMRLKYAKLLLNLGNAVDALCVPGARSQELAALAQDEGRAVLLAAGIPFVAEEGQDVDSRWKQMQVRRIGNQARAGSSTWQSLARGTGELETDYLNGEISLFGRLHGVPTPVNDTLCQLAGRLARERAAPERLSADDVFAQLSTRSGDPGKATTVAR